MADAFIYDALRTPRGAGRPSGGLHTLSPIDLGATVLTALAERTGCDRADIDDVVFGCGDPVEDQGADLARSSLLRAGFDERISGSVVTRFCSSGLDASNAAAARIMAGQADCMIAGGVEMMSLVPIGGTGGPWGSDAEFNTLTNYAPLGVAADLVATLDGHTRDDVDAYAVESQKRAARAWNDGRFARSIIPVNDFNGTLCLARDEHPRPNTDVASLAKLKPAFEGMATKGGFGDTVRKRYPQVNRLNHVHTAGNSAGIVDGASAILLGSEKLGRELDLKPRARFVSFATVGCDPCLMLTAPVDATRKCLSRAGLTLDDIDLFEVNEAFASVVLHFMQETGVSHDRVNVNGGAISLGHPIGATGTILTGTLLDELERTGGKHGVVTLCVGLGMGVATLIERV
ncbi:acetyl-CoA C-acetyltransferase [Pseudorhodoplanes sinuspersici]|uniref:Acetyl-CoA acetyltransferase n=1 Tax=Pseudorhodoplanes sinuspersici TaxID=1235591 RepID=A0A1W6ZR93_9HYPH|nr:acetyl-CoA C-acetyltransferase [Pseudorhodoplanes sinuspersici]ARP99640.1 acetyl-CoA acetyltransferase [Pseudorhodoplanes sinuspersici]RKE70614.1 acetyl-CoA C-acetyltransferase [Pseudorhodoplanes sinuspersici]